MTRQRRARRARQGSEDVVTTKGLAATVVVAGLALFAPLEVSAQALRLDAFEASAIEAMGFEPSRIELSGNGWDACLGQPWNVNDGWARWEIRDYRRVIDYDETTSVQTAMRRAGLDPERLGGCGAQPNAMPAAQETSVSSQSSWPIQLQIWLTPPGFLKLAERHDAAVARDGAGFELSFDVSSGGVDYTLRGHYGADYLLDRIETWIDDPIFGDLPVEAEFGEYRDFGGLKFPGSIVQRQGGYTTLHLDIDDVVTNTVASAVPPPRAGGRGGGQGAPSNDATPYAEIAEGVFVMNGAYQGVAVEFADYAVVIDGMQSDERTREIIRLTKEAIPGKPIRYVVNTHAHFDHASGLREFVAEGTTILTHETNVAFFEKALANPRTLNPAATNTAGIPIRIQGVGDELVLRDGAGRTLELHKLNGSVHADDMLIAFLPASGIVVEADLLQPWISPVFGGKGHPYLVHLAAELERLGLDYERFVPVHRPDPPPLMTRAALLGAVE